MKFDQYKKVFHKKRKAKIVTGWGTMKGKVIYRIEYIDDLKQVEVDEKELTECNDNDGWDNIGRKNIINHVNADDRCPDCGCYWTETKFNAKIWHDCNYCHKTKEEIMKKYENKTPNFWD
jgi:hypothetical protein